MSKSVLAQVQYIAEQLEEIFEGQSISQSDVVVVVAKAMELVETSVALSGPEKKRIVLQGVQMFLENHGSNTGWDAVMDQIVPIVIDQLISASKGGLLLNKKAIRSCFNMLKCC